MTSRTSATMAPSPTPGNTKALLACPTTTWRPSTRTGPKGLPEATTARPSDQARIASGVASALLLGLDSGRTIGRSWLAATARTSGSSNAFARPVVPMRVVDPAARAMAAGSASSASLSPQPASRSASTANGRLSASRSARTAVDQPMAVDHHDRRSDGGLVEPVEPEAVGHQLGDTERRGPGTEEQEPLAVDPPSARRAGGSRPAPSPRCPGCRR